MKPHKQQKPPYPAPKQGKPMDRCPIPWWTTAPREHFTKQAEAERVRQQRGIVYVNGLESSGAK